MKFFDVKIKICEIKIAIQFWRVISKNLWESSSLEGICLYIIFESIGSERDPAFLQSMLDPITSTYTKHQASASLYLVR